MMSPLPLICIFFVYTEMIMVSISKTRLSCNWTAKTHTVSFLFLVENGHNDPLVWNTHPNYHLRTLMPFQSYTIFYNETQKVTFWKMLYFQAIIHKSVQIDSCLLTPFCLPRKEENHMVGNNVMVSKWWWLSFLQICFTIYLAW